MEQYEDVGVVGTGQFGQVFKVIYKPDRSSWVCKRIPLSDADDPAETRKEAEIMASCHHENIVAFRETFLWRDPMNQEYVCIIEEWCQHGDLATELKFRSRTGAVFTEREVLDIASQLLAALDYLHSQRILHRDVKTQNVLVSQNGIVKLGDLGIAKVLNRTDELSKTVVGTPHYMPPEICKNQTYTFKSDMWSLGCVLFELCMQRTVFQGENILSLLYQITTAKVPEIPSDKGYSPLLVQLVKSMLAQDPNKRPSTREALRMPLLTQHAERMRLDGKEFRPRRIPASSNGEGREASRRDGQGTPARTNNPSPSPRAMNSSPVALPPGVVPGSGFRMPSSSSPVVSPPSQPQRFIPPPIEPIRTTSNASDPSSPWPPSSSTNNSNQAIASSPSDPPLSARDVIRQRKEQEIARREAELRLAATNNVQNRMLAKDRFLKEFHRNAGSKGDGGAAAVVSPPSLPPPPPSLLHHRVASESALARQKWDGESGSSNGSIQSPPPPPPPQSAREAGQQSVFSSRHDAPLLSPLGRFAQERANPMSFDEVPVGAAGKAFMAAAAEERARVARTTPTGDASPEPVTIGTRVPPILTTRPGPSSSSFTNQRQSASQRWLSQQQQQLEQAPASRLAIAIPTDSTISPVAPRATSAVGQMRPSSAFSDPTLAARQVTSAPSGNHWLQEWSFWGPSGVPIRQSEGTDGSNTPPPSGTSQRGASLNPWSPGTPSSLHTLSPQANVQPRTPPSSHRHRAALSGFAVIPEQPGLAMEGTVNEDGDEQHDSLLFHDDEDDEVVQFGTMRLGDSKKDTNDQDERLSVLPVSSDFYRPNSPLETGGGGDVSASPAATQSPLYSALAARLPVTAAPVNPMLARTNRRRSSNGGGALTPTAGRGSPSSAANLSVAGSAVPFRSRASAQRAATQGDPFRAPGADVRVSTTTRPVLASPTLPSLFPLGSNAGGRMAALGKSSGASPRQAPPPPPPPPPSGDDQVLFGTISRVPPSILRVAEQAAKTTRSSIASQEYEDDFETD